MWFLILASFPMQTNFQNTDASRQQNHKTPKHELLQQKKNFLLSIEEEFLLVFFSMSMYVWESFIKKVFATQTQDYPSVHLGKKIERQNEVKVSGNPVQSQLCYSIVSHSQVSITSVVSFKCDTQFSQSILSLRCVTHFCQSVVSISSVVQLRHWV